MHGGALKPSDIIPARRVIFVQSRDSLEVLGGVFGFKSSKRRVEWNSGYLASSWQGWILWAWPHYGSLTHWRRFLVDGEEDPLIYCPSSLWRLIYSLLKSSWLFNLICLAKWDIWYLLRFTVFRGLNIKKMLPLSFYQFLNVSSSQSIVGVSQLKRFRWINL